MKRNLFLTLMLSLSVNAACAADTSWVDTAKQLADEAEEWNQKTSLHTSESHKPEGYTNFWYGTHTVGNYIVTRTENQDTQAIVLMLNKPTEEPADNGMDQDRIGANSVLNIGCYTAAASGTPASLTVEKDASTGNCLFVGGKGYTGDVGHDDFWEDVTQQEGYLTVRNRATLTVGTETTKGLGAQLNVGQGDSGVGHMLVDGEGTNVVSNAIISVGNGTNSHGDMLVDNGAHVTVQATEKITDLGTALHIGVGAGSDGHITVDNGGALYVCDSQQNNLPENELDTPELGAGKASSFIGQGSTERKTSTGELTVKNGSYVQLDGTTVLGYYGGSKGELNLQGNSSAMSEGLQLGIEKNAEGTVNVESGSKMTLLGAAHVGVNGKGTLNVDGTGTKLYSLNSVYAGFYAGSEGDINITEGAELMLSGTVYVGRDGKGKMTNNGTLSGKTVVNGNGELHGAGTFGTTTVKEGGKLFVGDDAPATQTYTGNLALEESTTMFSVADLTLPSAETQDAWISQSHSLIKMTNGSDFSINETTRFLIAFSGEEMPSVGSAPVDLGDFSILLVQGGVGSDVAALCDTLLSNSTFTFAADSLGRAAETWTATIKGAHYLVENNNLYLVAGSIPEPATATLSLLALAALASRRRRK